MKPRPWLLAGLLVPMVLGARTTTPPDIDALMRAGNALCDRGAYAEAVLLYEKASDRATEPGLVAFNLATAKYHLARGGDARALADAEHNYRCCLEKGDARRPRALFGLGNCLLLRAASSSLDAVALRSAIDRYSECLLDPGCDADLAEDARYNRQKARLLLLQAPPPPESSTDDGASEEKPEDLPDPPKDADNMRPGGSGDENPEKGSKSIPTRGGPEQPGGDQEGTQAPGQGTLPPLHDGGEAKPLATNEAVEHLEQATKRILDEMKAYRRTRARPSGSGVRDW